MKTPTKYSKLVKKNELDKELIGHVAFSINKRAKNYRDKRNEYRYSNYRHAYSCMQSYEEKMNEAYTMKTNILSLFKPIEVHQATFKNEFYKIVYSDQPEYSQIKPHQVRSTGRSLTTGNKYKEILIEKSRIQYFLHYEINNFKFHQPIDEIELENYADLSVKILEDNFKVDRKKGTELLSAQFCKKVYQLLQSGEYTLIE